MFCFEFIVCCWFIARLWFIANSSNILHVRQICCVFIERIVCSSNSWFVWFLLTISHMFWFSIKTKNLCLSFDLCFVWNRFFAIKHLYEYNENFILIINNKIDWFFRLEMLETIYDEKIMHRKMSRSNLIDIFILILLHSKQFHEIDRFMSIFRNFFSKNVCVYSCSKMLFVRNKRR